MSKTVYELAAELLGYPGKMLSGAKQADPERQVVSNANVFMVQRPSGRPFMKKFPPPIKIWFGDISLTESAEALEELAAQTYSVIYILREHDGRFDNEKSLQLDKAVAKFGGS